MLSLTSVSDQLSEGFMCTPSMAEEELTDVYMNRLALSGSLNMGLVSNKDFRLMSILYNILNNIAMCG